MTRDEWAAFEKIQFEPKVIQAMKARCEEQGHEMEPCVSAMFRFYQECKWCGHQKAPT